MIIVFQSTSLTRGTTKIGHHDEQYPRNFNPRPSHEGRPRSTPFFVSLITISIHVPHTRDDRVADYIDLFKIDFNPRPSHEGRQNQKEQTSNTYQFQSTSLTRGTTLTWDDVDLDGLKFQSTSLTRGTTLMEQAKALYLEDFNPRPSHEGRQQGFFQFLPFSQFQSTSLTRGTTAPAADDDDPAKFQSTSLTRGTTKLYPLTQVTQAISIHVPHTRDDATDFKRVFRSILFQSTSLTRGTTPHGRDTLFPTGNFNPRPSHEGRLSGGWFSYAVFDFNPRPSHEGRHRY